MTAYEPGAVAMIRRGGTSAERRALRVGNIGWHLRPCSDEEELTDRDFVLDAAVTDVRPLVVIDAEDREQVERLRNETLRMLCDHIGIRAVEDSAFTEGDLANAMQAALREFATPKPEEPADPKARVTDRRDNIWRLLADGDWVCTSGPDIGEYLEWSRLAGERGPLEVQS